jgi:hypothetical protein
MLLSNVWMAASLITAGMFRLSNRKEVLQQQQQQQQQPHVSW